MEDIWTPDVLLQILAEVQCGVLMIASAVHQCPPLANPGFAKGGTIASVYWGTCPFDFQLFIFTARHYAECSYVGLSVCLSVRNV